MQKRSHRNTGGWTMTVNELKGILAECKDGERPIGLVMDDGRVESTALYARQSLPHRFDKVAGVWIPDENGKELLLLG